MSRGKNTSGIPAGKENLGLFWSFDIAEANEKIEELIGHLSNVYDPYELEESGPKDAISQVKAIQKLNIFLDTSENKLSRSFLRKSSLENSHYFKLLMWMQASLEAN